MQGRVYPDGHGVPSNGHEACDPRISRCGVLDVTGPGLYGKVLDRFGSWDKERCVLHSLEQTEILDENG
jgi:hypothetical protein